VRKGVVFEHVADPVGADLSGGLWRLDQEDGELVATVAADHVDAARVLEENLADAAESLVARRVAQRVVDGLEAVEIEQHDGHRVLEAAVAGDLLLEPNGEEAAIVQPRHLVLERDLLEPRVGGLELPVGGVETRRELVDLAGLGLDGAEHPREGAHEHADLVGLLCHRRFDPGRGGHRLGGAADSRAQIPDDETSRGYEESGEDQQRLAPEEIAAVERLVAEPRHHEGVERISEDEERHERREGQRERDLPPQPGGPERRRRGGRRRLLRYRCRF
jgi:hypothetical protein